MKGKFDIEAYFAKCPGLTLARCHDESVSGGLWHPVASNYLQLPPHLRGRFIFGRPGGYSKLWQLRLAANGTKEKTIKGMKPIAIEVQPMTTLQVAIQ